MSQPLSNEDREELIAYLDGEVSEEQAREIETRMSLDPTVRAEADSLKRTWDLLDYLPKPEASPNFTHRTLDRLSAKETQQALQATLPARRWLLAAGWAAAMLLCAVGAYAATRAFQPAIEPRPSETDLVRELRVIENLRYYQPIETIDFLKELDHRDLFGEDWES